MPSTPTSQRWLFLAALSYIVLFGCSEDGGSAADSVGKQGLFLDSAVSGISYQSTSYSGDTDSYGQFSFKPGEATTFSYNGLELGSIVPDEANPIVTPLNLLGANSVNDQPVLNLLVFLQTLDGDQNPDNGITISSVSVLETGGNFINEFNSATASTTLDFNDANFQSSLLQAIADAGLPPISVLVNETDALDHFNETQAILTAVSPIVGNWAMRSESGDISALYEFSSDGTLTVTEYDDCNNNNIYWAATVASAAANCTSRTLNLDWVQNGNTITNTSTTNIPPIEDVCTALIMNKAKITANCEFTGSGLGQELIIFERQATTFSAADLQIDHIELSPGDNTDYTTNTFNSDFSGSYQVIQNGTAQTSAGDQGDYAWSIGNNQLTISGTDNSSAAFSIDYNLTAYQFGSWHVNFIDPDSNTSKTAILKANYDENDVNFIGGISNNIAAYDATSGACKRLINATYINPTSGTSPFDVYTSSNLNSAICDELSVVTSPISTTGTLVIDSGSIEISNSDNTTERCWPISSNRLTEQQIFVMACSTYDGTTTSDFDFEIWRPIGF